MLCVYVSSYVSDYVCGVLLGLTKDRPLGKY